MYRLTYTVVFLPVILYCGIVPLLSFELTCSSLRVLILCTEYKAHITPASLQNTEYGMVTRQKTNTKMIANAAAGGMDRLRQHSYICPSYSNKEHAGWSLSIFVLATKLMTIAHLADSRMICCIAG